ncbi:hypothetical protein [Nocardioides acrostichi]|uniref:Uncharacterized protein n=1 Tax=Nocardioides acrostichi TaxID=2784339 RepID=A0A930YA74_9ACTN|nr:hypothetical protein [Nocardioides acrostichi]MBF4161123.1 hypothetical protein [Nocardioides acrostichi]
MPTARSSTEPPPGVGSDLRRAVVDVGILLRFRASSVRRPRAMRLGLALLAAVTLAAAVAPALLPGAGSSPRAQDAAVLLPTVLSALVLIAVISAVASGGGRELVARDPASVHPISPTTDHLGALLLAPVNIAWVIQSWALLGSTAFALGADRPARLAAAQVGMLLWLVLATSLAQVVAWALEGLRRIRYGVGVIRGGAVVLLGALVGLQMTERLVPVLDHLPTLQVVVGLVFGFTPRWCLTVSALVLLVLAAVGLGALLAHAVARRIPRDELRAESGSRRALPQPRSDVLALVRVDRGSVWRAVPMRRGAAVLALAPAVIALIGDLAWAQLVLLPGLVCAGGALLFGVNAWCLDGRGGLWRESLPVESGLVFDARSWVVAEFLLAVSLGTLLVGGLRSGLPSAGEAVALGCAVVVVTVQVLAAAMRWSIKAPHAVDLRSARATPAPPVAMIGYSSRLALSTTVTVMVFSLAATLGDATAAPVLALPMLLWSSYRWVRARNRWVDPQQRAAVIVTTAA